MKEEDIVIIDNYRDLILEDYLLINSVMRDDSLDDLDKEVKVISILTGKTEKEILDLPIYKYKMLSVKSSFLWTDLPTNGRLAKSYKIGDFDLVPVMDMRKITTAQYIDFQNLHKEGMEDHFPEILSCILLPKGKKYCEDYELHEVADAIRQNLSVYDGGVIYAFFMISCEELTRDILISSLQEIDRVKNQRMKENLKEEIQTQLKLLKKGGDGCRK